MFQCPLAPLVLCVCALFIIGFAVPFAFPRKPSEAITRYVHREPTDVSIFASYESVVDTAGLFGVKSASSLVVGTLRVVSQRFFISAVRLVLSLHGSVPVSVDGAGRKSHSTRTAARRHAEMSYEGPLRG